MNLVKADFVVEQNWVVSFVFGNPRDHPIIEEAIIVPRGAAAIINNKWRLRYAPRACHTAQVGHIIPLTLVVINFVAVVVALLCFRVMKSSAQRPSMSISIVYASSRFK